MRGPNIRNIRPALWGFFVCLAIAVGLFITKFYVPSYVSGIWDSERNTRKASYEKIIRSAFNDHVEHLTKILNRVSADSFLTRNLYAGNSDSTTRVFNVLDSYQIKEGQTLDLLDSLGNSIAWNGPSIARPYSELVAKKPKGVFIRVTQNGLRTYLSVGKRINSGKYFLLASEPLELNSPISNRFIQKESFSEDLSQKLKVKVTLRIPGTEKPRSNESVVKILDTDGNEVVEFLMEEKSIESEINAYQDILSAIISISLALGSVLAVILIVQFTARAKKTLLTAAVGIISIWLVRFIWHYVDFPLLIINGWLFNPKLYSAPFIFGLCSSLGELILTVFASIASAWLIFKNVVLTEKQDNDEIRTQSIFLRGGALIIFFVLALIILWIFRGYSEAIRSFVFDSTIRFNNPAEILLDGTTSIMLLNILLLGISVICVSIVFIWEWKREIQKYYQFTTLQIRFIYIFFLFVCIPIFFWIDDTPQSQYLNFILFAIIVLALTELFSFWNNSNSAGLAGMRLVVPLMLGAFLLGIPLLHQKMQQKEHKDIEVMAKELMRPSDNWLSYVLLDGIRSSVENIKNEHNANDILEAKKSNLAFILWTKTLLGREGYSSALVIYNQAGDESDRFVVGMNKLEQKEILTRVFNSEENSVQIIGISGQKRLGKLYGAWIMLRDSNENFIGSLALILSDQQKTYFYTQEAEPLRQYGDRLENDEVREVAFQEYRRDTLVFSTGTKLSPDKILSSEIATDLKKTPDPVLWKDMNINGVSTETLFLKDSNTPDKIISISLEKLDVRWELFNYLKEFIFCLVILAIAGIYISIQHKNRITFPILGFKGKLFLGFACITLLPLTILSYYNKQLASERIQEQVEETLYRELSQIQERINTYVVDEKDFIVGVDDDFCEAIASEYGIDFSVYRDASIQASSLSELYRSGFLDGRLNGKVFSASVLSGKNTFLSKEKIGSVDYVVGYAPITVAGSVVGVLAIPTLNREKDIEAELAQRNAYVFGAYAIVFGIALMGGGLLALRFARPLNQLTLAAKEVSEGNLNIQVKSHSRDEIGILARSFNDMVLKLEQSREELSKHERESAWKEMAKQIAHEIRNPLTPIKLSVQHMRQAFKDKAPDREEILQRVTQTVIEQIDVLSRIASEFSSFAKMPATKFERLDVGDLLKETIDLFKEVQGISFVHKSSVSPAVIIADRDQLRGVFINIIRNAIQAMQGTGSINTEIGLEKHACIVKISDTGPGISEDMLKKIFEPNFSTKTEGMGLGLAIARRVIEDHGGTINCSSEQGIGTTFEIRLPA